MIICFCLTYMNNLQFYFIWIIYLSISTLSNAYNFFTLFMHFCSTMDPLVVAGARFAAFINFLYTVFISLEKEKIYNRNIRINYSLLYYFSILFLIISIDKIVILNLFGRDIFIILIYPFHVFKKKICNL